MLSNKKKHLGASRQLFSLVSFIFKQITKYFSHYCDLLISLSNHPFSGVLEANLLPCSDLLEREINGALMGN